MKPGYTNEAIEAAVKEALWRKHFGDPMAGLYRVSDNVKCLVNSHCVVVRKLDGPIQISQIFFGRVTSTPVEGKVRVLVDFPGPIRSERLFRTEQVWVAVYMELT